MLKERRIEKKDENANLFFLYKNMDKIYDNIIIGSGPAGLTAAIYASRAELDFLIIEKDTISGGQIINTYEIENYPGFPGISGLELAEKFRKHCEMLGVSFVKGNVDSFQIENGVKEIQLDNGETYRAKTIIIASGAENRKLNVPGENELQGRGVSYCATCDGAFFRNKVTAVIGGGDVALEDAIFLARICKKVYVIHRRDQFRGAKSLISKLTAMENVEIIWNHVVEKVAGEDFVTGLDIKEAKSSEKRSILVDGVFIAVGTIPKSEVYQEKLAVDESGYLLADETGKTSEDGVFAAGDIRKKQLRQIITAAADGANAVLSVERYLNEEV